MEVSIMLPPIVGYSGAFEKSFYPFMNWDFYTTDYRALNKVGEIFEFLPNLNPLYVPRLPHIKTAYPTHIIRPYQKKINDITLYDACRLHAKEIVDRNQPIVLFWSGGIDSTLAACFLLDYMKNSEQITIYYTPESLTENPRFVDYIKKFGVRMLRWDLEYKNLFAPDQIIVTGDGPDCLSGYIGPKFYNTNKEWLFNPWQDFFAFKGLTSTEISCIENIVNQHDIDPVVKLCDMYWWFYMYITYQFPLCRVLALNLENLSKNNAIGFFDCDNTNQWSLANRAFISQYRSQHEYKQCFRDEIAKFWPNTEYVTNKPKVSSRQGPAWSQAKRLLHKQDFLFLYWQNGQIKSYMPDHYPIFDREQILQDLRGMQ
jgi:hypothetical protein